MDSAFEAREAAEIGVPGLVDSLDPSHAVAGEVGADLRREALVENQAVAAHVDLDQDRAAPGDRQGHEHVDRWAVPLDLDWDDGTVAPSPSARIVRSA